MLISEYENYDTCTIKCQVGWKLIYLIKLIWVVFYNVKFRPMCCSVWISWHGPSRFYPPCQLIFWNVSWHIYVIFFSNFIWIWLMYDEYILKELMYLQVSIVSADALEPAGPEHLSANASLVKYINLLFSVLALQGLNLLDSYRNLAILNNLS